jgi:ElaB/YqjD/DUF883 family membrane-anchored ribosome-binding protein
MTVKSTIGSMAEDAAHGAREAGSASADWARSASSEAAERTAQAAQAAYDQGDRAVGLLGRYIEERPVTSVVAAFGLGLVTASLLRSRR